MKYGTASKNCAHVIRGFLEPDSLIAYATVGDRRVSAKGDAGQELSVRFGQRAQTSHFRPSDFSGQPAPRARPPFAAGLRRFRSLAPVAGKQLHVRANQPHTILFRLSESILHAFPLSVPHVSEKNSEDKTRGCARQREAQIANALEPQSVRRLRLGAKSHFQVEQPVFGRHQAKAMQPE